MNAIENATANTTARENEDPQETHSRGTANMHPCGNRGLCAPSLDEAKQHVASPPPTSERAVWRRWLTLIVISGLLIGTSIIVAGVCGAGLCHSEPVPVHPPAPSLQQNDSDRIKLGAPLIVVPGWSTPILRVRVDGARQRAAETTRDCFVEGIVQFSWLLPLMNPMPNVNATAIALWHHDDDSRLGRGNLSHAVHHSNLDAAQLQRGCVQEWLALSFNASAVPGEL